MAKSPITTRSAIDGYSAYMTLYVNGIAVDSTKMKSFFEWLEAQPGYVELEKPWYYASWRHLMQSFCLYQNEEEGNQSDDFPDELEDSPKQFKFSGPGEYHTITATTYSEAVDEMLAYLGWTFQAD